MWLLHRRALERGVTPTVPATVVVEAWRGGALMAKFMSGTTVEPLDEARARVAGRLLGRTVGGSAVDATVVEGALRRHETVVTSDRSDLERLADGVGRRLAVIDI